MAAEVGGTEGEDSWVHWSLEEEDGNQDANGRLAVSGSDISVEGNSAACVDGEEEVRLKDGGQASGDEATDSEGDQAVGKHVGGLSGSVVGVLGGVVDEEACDCDLGADVAELGDEAEDHIVLLVERRIPYNVSISAEAVSVDAFFEWDSLI